VDQEPGVTDDEDFDYSKAFDLGFQVDQVVGVTMGEDNKPLFLIKWKETEKNSLVPATVANQRYTKEVIEFYEERIVMPEKMGVM